MDKCNQGTFELGIANCDLVGLLVFYCYRCFGLLMQSKTKGSLRFGLDKLVARYNVMKLSLQMEDVLQEEVLQVEIFSEFKVIHVHMGDFFFFLGNGDSEKNLNA